MSNPSRSKPPRAIGLALLLTIPVPAATAQHPGMTMARGPAADSVLAAARRVAAAIPDTAAARAAGYRPVEEIGVPDRNPFQGQHWFKAKYSDTLPDVPLSLPAFVLFAPVDGRLQRIALAYATRLRLEADAPAALGGDSAAMWHAHVLCNRTARDGRPIVDQDPDTAACRASGGTPRRRKTVMIHVWTDVANPEGIYGHDNPALPFIVLGLTPPAMADLHDAARARATRALAVALGEAYGARLENAYLIEGANQDSALADSLRVRRAAIAALVPQLRQADVAHDRNAYDHAAARIRAEGEAVQRIYERMATPEARALLRRQYEEILSKSAMM
jgi:hypothetical protein